jgi:acetoin utilization protein AcuB
LASPGTTLAPVAGMKVKDCMQQRVVAAKPRDSLRHVREILERERINQLPVVVNARVVGIVTDRDLRDAFPSVIVEMDELRGGTRRAGPDPEAVTVEEVMTPNVITVAPEADIADVAGLMRRERIGAVPVIEHERLVGIVARSDLLAALQQLAAAPRDV